MDERLLIVSNSSPIMNLAIIGQLHLIQELFGEIVIPKEVWAELIIEEKGKVWTNEIEKAKWIKVAKVKNDSLLKIWKNLEPKRISGSNQISTTPYFQKWVKFNYAEI